MAILLDFQPHLPPDPWKSRQSHLSDVCPLVPEDWDLVLGSPGTLTFRLEEALMSAPCHSRLSENRGWSRVPQGATYTAFSSTWQPRMHRWYCHLQKLLFFFFLQKPRWMLSLTLRNSSPPSLKNNYIRISFIYSLASWGRARRGLVASNTLFFSTFSNLWLSPILPIWKGLSVCIFVSGCEAWFF